MNDFNFIWNFSEIPKNSIEAIDEHLGFVSVGEIHCDIVIRDYGTDSPCLVYDFDFYVLGEDTGYGYREIDGVERPYDYADGDGISVKKVSSFADLKNLGEKLIAEYVKNFYNGRYSLLEKAAKKTVVW